MMRRIVIFCFALFAILIPSLRVSAISNRPIDQKLLDACHDGNLPLSRALLALGADVNARDDSGTTPLMMAAMAGKDGDLILFLAAKGADVNAHDRDGMTPLMHAAFDGDIPTMDLLLRLGADREARDKQGQTALFEACDHPDAFKYLLDHEADIRVRDKDGLQPIHEAAMFGHVECLRWLLARGANVNARDHDEQTPLSVDRGILVNETLMIYLLEHGADPEARDAWGTPAWMTLLYHTALIRCALAHGAKIDDRDGDGKTALMLMAESEQSDKVRLLISLGANVNARDKHGETAYSLLAKHDDYSRDHVIAVLIAAGEKDARVIPRKPDIPLSPTSDEYAVIATILRNVGTGSRYTVFVRDTIKGKEAAAVVGGMDAPGGSHSIALLAKDLPEDLVRAYLTSTAPSEVIPADASISGIRFIREVDREAVFENGGWWTAFYKKYPKSNGYMKISLPVFDGKHQQALVYISGAAGGLAGGGSLCLYKKTDQGWQEAKSVQLWVS